MPKTKESTSKSKQVKEKKPQNTVLEQLTFAYQQWSSANYRNGLYGEALLATLKGWNETLDVFDSYIGSTKDHGHKQFVLGTIFGMFTIATITVLCSLISR